jgi:glycosyltransferase involved in cell wall biosynthesis
MPWTTYCADSLMKDYKIVFSKIIIAPGYINIQAWDSGKIPRDFLKKRLLFVGNDFKRKGGDFLLEILKLLDKSYHLTIVTNDSSVNSDNLPENVEVIKGVNSLTQLGPIYESSSLFVFPTKREQMGVVLMEAAATGLPSIVTDVGGVTEIIKHNKTGILMPYSSSAAEWAIAIENIFKQPEQLHKFSQYTNTLSKEKFSKSAYVKLLKDAFELALKS